MNRIFEGLNMLEKSWNFAHTSELAKIYVWYGCGKMARQRHLYTFNGVRLELRFTYMYENRYTHVTPQYLQKRLLEQNPKPNRKSVIFNFMSKFCVFFAIFMRCTLTNSS